MDHKRLTTGKNQKEDSLHVRAIKFIGRSSWSILFSHTLKITIFVNV